MGQHGEQVICTDSPQAQSWAWIHGTSLTQGVLQWQAVGCALVKQQGTSGETVHVVCSHVKPRGILMCNWYLSVYDWLPLNCAEVRMPAYVGRHGV